MKCAYCKKEVPFSSNYCPNCGNRIEKESCIGDIWSSVDDFSKGNIIMNGVILGKTSLEELTQKYDVEHSFDEYAADINKNIEVVITDYKISDVDSLNSRLDEYINPSAVNEIKLLNAEQVVNEVRVRFVEEGKDIECPFMSELGFTRHCYPFEKESNICIFKEMGWIQIQNIKTRDKDQSVATFVTKQPNQNEDFIFARICRKRIEFYTNLMREWISYKTGELIHAMDFY